MNIYGFPDYGTDGIKGYPQPSSGSGGSVNITIGGGLGSSVNPDGSITLFASGPYLLYNSDPSIIGGKKLLAGNNTTIVEGSTSVTLSAQVTGSGATSSGSYVTAVSEGSLPQSRVATQGNGITITDGGAAGPMTFGVATSITGANILTWTSGDTIFTNRRQFIPGSGLSAAYGTNTLTLSVTGQTSGTVTSIDVAAPASLLTSTGGPVTTAGTITIGLTNASANFVWAGPSSGGAGAPSYRALVPNDIPSTIPATKIGSGSVDNTEFAFLDGASANIQDQINNKQPYDPTLTALATYNTNGLMTQTAPDTFTGRTITGQAGRISVSNGDGTAGNPLVDVGSSVYTIGGTDVAIGDGGTGISTAPTSGQVLIGNSSNGYTLNTITPGSGIQITNGNGSITIASSGATGGTVTSVAVGNLSPLFTSNVATATTTPSVTYTLVDQSSGQFYAGPKTGSAAAPGFRAIAGQDLSALVAGSNITITPVGDTLVFASTASGGGGGSISSVAASSNVPTPLFTASVTNPTTTPTIVFTVSSIPAGHFYSGPYNILGPGNGSPDVPSFRTIQVGDLPTGISATQIGFGTVNSTEYSYLDGASANIQDQLNSKGPGTVTSVGIAPPTSLFTASGSPVTSAGNITLSLTNAASGQFWAGPATGAATTPTYRVIVVSDLPTTTVNSVGNLSPLFTASISNQALAFAQVPQASGQFYAGPVSGANVNPTFRAMASGDLPSGIPASKIGAGTVDDAEYGYLNGVTNAIQTQIDGKQPLDATLTALAAYNANGFVTQTGADTFAARTLAVAGGLTIQESGTVITISASGVSGGGGTTVNSTCQGRLTLESGVAVSTTSQTAKTTLYWTPYAGNQVALINSASTWAVYTVTEKSISLSGLTASRPYDVFLYDNGGTPTLELTSWTSDTARATNIVFQDGVYVRSGNFTRRYLGTIRITGTTGQCEDSSARRFVWNYYNRVSRSLVATDSTDTWTYSSTTYRPFNNSSTDGTGRVAVVVGVTEDVITLDATNLFGGSAVSTQQGFCGIGVDSTTTSSATLMSPNIISTTNGTSQTRTSSAKYMAYPAIGYHFYSTLEKCENTNTLTFCGDNGNNTTYQSGMIGVIYG